MPRQSGTGLSLPDEMPDAWARRIEGIVNAGTSPRLWVVLLGSSLLAAVIGCFSSILTTNLAGRQGQDLEITKARIQKKAENVKAETDAYEKLRVNLQELSDRLGAAGTLFRAGADQSDATIDAELNSVGQAASDVITSENGRLIGEEFKKYVHQVLDTFLEALSRAQNDHTKLDVFLKLVDPTIKQIEGTQAALRQVEEALDKAAADAH